MKFGDDSVALANECRRAGLAGFFAVLNAERRRLEAESALAESDTEVLQSYVAVYRAMGVVWCAGLPAR